MDFEQHGFQTGEVLLPGLDIIVRLNENRYFRDDGVVEDVNARTKKIYEKLGVDGTPPIFDNIKGMCQLFLLGNKSATVIYVKKGRAKDVLFRQGHESTHFLIQSNLDIYLISALDQEGFTLNPFDRYNDDEEIAHIGGLLALYKRNYKPGRRTVPPILTPFWKELMKSKKTKSSCKHSSYVRLQ